MSPEESRGQAPAAFDPEAEQEVDFGRYWRLIAARWWLLAAGARRSARSIGYRVSLGGSQTFKATATRLSRPAVLRERQRPAAEPRRRTRARCAQIAHARDRSSSTVARQCKAKPGDLRGGISTQSVAGNISKNGQTPLVAITVQSQQAPCRGRARRTRSRGRSSIGRRRFANQKIANFSAQIIDDEQQHRRDQPGARAAAASRATDKLVLQIRLAQARATSCSTTPAPAPGEAGREAGRPHGRGRAARHGAQPAQHGRRRRADRPHPRRDRRADVGRRRRRHVAPPRRSSRCSRASASRSSCRRTTRSS